MKFLFTTQPGFGHLLPLIPLAQALEQMGHEVLVACAASFLPQVAQAGLEGRAAGLDWLESNPEIAFPEAEGLTTSEREIFFAEIFVDITANHMAYDLLTICQEWQPNVIVRDAFEYGGCIVGEKLNIPYAAVDMELYVPAHITRDGMEGPLAYLRSAFDLPAYPAMEMLTRNLYLSYIPPSYQFPEYHLPNTAHALRPTFLDAKGDELLPPWLATLPDRPTIYTTMGTSFNNVPEIMRLIIAALRDEPVNVIITVGPGQDPKQYTPIPDNIHIEQFIPQSALMPYCDLVITNGGVGTSMIALSHGRPLLLIPLGGHLQLHALRCRALGIGLSLKLPPGMFDVNLESFDDEDDTFVTRQAKAMIYDNAPELSADSLWQAVSTLLHDPAYRQAAKQLQAEILAMAGPQAGAALLAQLAER